MTKIQRVRVFKSFKDAEMAEIRDFVSMTPAQRLKITHALRIRVFGRKSVDIRSHYKKI